MATTPNSQAKLASDPAFLRRFASLLLMEAQVVAAESTGVPSHTQRRQLAQSIINAPADMARNLAPTVCNATNMLAANTTYDFVADGTVTDATDAQIRSQISTLGNILAGV